MKKIREWGFPVALIAAWVLAAAYTLSLMIDVSGRAAPAQPEPPAAEATVVPES